MTGVLSFLAFLALWVVLFLIWRKVNPLRRWAKVSPDQVEDDDPIMRMVVAAAWNTGKPIAARIDEHGNLVMKPLDEILDEQAAAADKPDDDLPDGADD